MTSVFPGTKVNAGFCLVWKMNFNVLLFPRRVPQMTSFFIKFPSFLPSDIVSDFRSNGAFPGPDMRRICVVF